MARHIRLLILILLSLQWEMALGQTKWMKRYADEGLKVWSLRGIDIGKDDGYVVTGETPDDLPAKKFYGSNVVVMSLDNHGNVHWARTYSGTGFETGVSVERNGNSFLVAGYTESNDGFFENLNPTKSGVFLISLDLYGNTRWVHVFPADCISQDFYSPHSNRAFTGRIELVADSNITALLSCDTIIVLNERGQVTGQHHYLRDTIFPYSIGNRLRTINPRRYITVGVATEMRDDEGELIWQIPVRGVNVFMLKDDEIAVTPPRQFGKCTVIDTNGVILREDGNEVQFPWFFDHVAFSEESIFSARIAEVLKTSLDGRTHWRRVFQGPSGSNCSTDGVPINCIVPTPDGGCAIVGFSACWSSIGGDFRVDDQLDFGGDSAAFVAKLDINGHTQDSTTNVKDDFLTRCHTGVTVSPSLVFDKALVTFFLKTSTDLRLNVMSMSGEVVQSVDVGTMLAGDHTFDFDSNNLASGVYLLQLQTAADVLTTMIVVAH